jgi:hypothetical protein
VVISFFCSGAKQDAPVKAYIPDLPPSRRMGNPSRYTNIGAIFIMSNAAPGIYLECHLCLRLFDDVVNSDGLVKIQDSLPIDPSRQGREQTDF